MAKSKETFIKKEKEKKRLQQKKEKTQKREERKANKKDGNSLDDMIVYLDENGNFTDTPPDPSKKKEINQEDIVIGVPKHEEEVVEFKEGVVNYYNRVKGFGFINEKTTGERVFFHINDLLSSIDESDKVKFKVINTHKGLSAVEISRL